MPRKMDYSQLWQNKTEGAPKASIIGGLQKLLNEKEDYIMSLTSQLNDYKSRIQEYDSITSQMEQEFMNQRNQIQYLQQQIQAGGMGQATSPSVGQSNAEDKQKIDQLTNQLRDMENKLYIFSNLPTRITDLEAKLEKANKTIDQYDENQEKLKETIRRLSGDGGSSQIISDLQQKVRQQEQLIGTLQNNIPSRTASQNSAGNLSSGNIQQLQDQLIQLTDEKNQLITQLNQFSAANREIVAKLEASKNTIQSLQSGATNGSGNDAMLHNRIMELEADLTAKNNIISQQQTMIRSKISENNQTPSSTTGNNASDPQLIAENRNLGAQVTELKEKLRAEQMKIEEIVEKVQKSSKTKELQDNIQQLTSELQYVNQNLVNLQNENIQLKEELKNKETFLAGMSGAELIQNLNLKINKLSNQNKKLENELQDLKKGNTSDTSSIPTKPISSLKPSAPVIRAIDGPSSKEKELSLQISQLQKQVAEKDVTILKLNKDVVEVQTNLAELKASGPSSDSNSNMMNLMQDLQTKIRKMKQQLRMKDEEIASLKK